jgi:TrmH family RNA methyltransferase
VLELQRAAQKQPALHQSELLVTEAYADWQSPFRTEHISSKKMAQISDTKTPPGIVAVVPMAPVPVSKDSANIAIYLHEIQDPGNLGTILRTLAWFGGFRCLLSPGSVDPYNPKVVRASMGAIFHVPLETEVELTSLSQRFHRLACLDLNGHNLTEPGFADHDCYLFGNEARGIPAQALGELNATAYTINGKGQIESLNLASAVNICSWELMRN